MTEADRRAEIGELIAARVNEMGISFLRAAELCDMNATYFLDTCKGKTNITLKTLAKIEQALKFKI